MGSRPKSEKTTIAAGNSGVDQFARIGKAIISTTHTTLITIQATAAIVLARGRHKKKERIVVTNRVRETVNAKMHIGMKIQSPESLAAK